MQAACVQPERLFRTYFIKIEAEKLKFGDDQGPLLFSLVFLRRLSRARQDESQIS